jgi:hypothetical protein
MTSVTVQSLALGQGQPETPLAPVHLVLASERITVRELIRRDQDRTHLRGLLLAGASSPPAEPADQDYFATLRTGMHDAA